MPPSPPQRPATPAADDLDDLLSAITPDNLHDPVDFGPPVGKEICWEDTP